MTFPEVRPVLTVRETSPRMTPEPATRRFGDVLTQGGRALLNGAVAAASYLPGGNMIAAVLRGAPLGPGPTTLPSASGPSVEAPGAGPAASPTGTGSSTTADSTDDDILTRGQDQSMRMLRLQEAISEENRRYTALSNVLHARHEMAKNAIGNIR